MLLRDEGAMRRGLRRGLLTAGVSLGALAAPLAVHALDDDGPRGRGLAGR